MHDHQVPDGEEGGELPRNVFAQAWGPGFVPKAVLVALPFAVALCWVPDDWRPLVAVPVIMVPLYFFARYEAARRRRAAGEDSAEG
ncbi:hypothetical protein ACIQGZ_16715 [Streptomyces sp. NPDC092296]|uniref:hypothetical protein n=1 Tax=Streptomyces sp. NPDC092296 TaxID=3366012 RepID=UPI003822A22B